MAWNGQGREPARPEVAPQSLQGTAKDIYVLKRIAIWVIGGLTILAVLFVVLVAVVHLFIPSLGWLTAEEQNRIADIYGVLASYAFPVIAILSAITPLLRRVFEKQTQ